MMCSGNASLLCQAPLKLRPDRRLQHPCPEEEELSDGISDGVIVQDDERVLFLNTMTRCESFRDVAEHREHGIQHHRGCFVHLSCAAGSPGVEVTALHCLVVGGKSSRFRVYVVDKGKFICISGTVKVFEFQQFGSAQIGTREIRIPFYHHKRIRLSRTTAEALRDRVLLIEHTSSDGHHDSSGGIVGILGDENNNGFVASNCDFHILRGHSRDHYASMLSRQVSAEGSPKEATRSYVADHCKENNGEFIGRIEYKRLRTPPLASSSPSKAFPGRTPKQDPVFRLLIFFVEHIVNGNDHNKS
jgi:hypothetical protein